MQDLDVPWLLLKLLLLRWFVEMAVAASIRYFVTWTGYAGLDVTAPSLLWGARWGSLTEYVPPWKRW
jgi:hypothetical protein